MWAAFTAVAGCLLLVACAIAQPNPFHGPCGQSVAQLAVSGNLNYFTPLISNQLGNQGGCENNVGRFCTLSLTVVCLDAKQQPYTLDGAVTLGCGFMPVYGACMPTDKALCPTSLMDLQLDEFLYNYTAFQYLFAALGCAAPSMVPAVCPNGYPPFASMRATCLDDLPRFQDDSSAVAVFAAILVLCVICVAATFIGLVERIWLWWARITAEEEADRTAESGSAYSESLPLASHGAAPLINDFGASSATAIAAKNDSLHYHHSTALGPQVSSPIPQRLRSIAKWFDLLVGIESLLEVKVRNFADVNTLFFEGLRTISMLFVLYGHTYFWPLDTTGYTNNAIALEFFRSYQSIGLFPAELAVDNFFFLSGFLFMHLYMKQIEKRQSAKQKAALATGEEAATGDYTAVAEPLSISETLLMYVRRWLRITPVAMIALFAAEYLLRYLPTGAMHQTYPNNPMFTDCANDWWKQMLYIANYYDADGCMGWFWYLNCDFQLFLLGGVLAWLYYKTQRLSVWIWWFIMLLCMAITVGYAGHYEPYTAKYYGRTYTRAAPYFYGVVTAVLVRSEAARRLARRFRNRFFIYFFSLGLIVSCINIMWYYDPVKSESRTSDSYIQFLSIYVPLGWGLGWLLLCLAWCPGHGGIFCRFLSHPIFIVMSKLTFCAYVLHPIIMTVDIANQPMPITFSVQTDLMRFGGYYLWTLVSAVVLHVVVELPFANINDALTRR